MRKALIIGHQGQDGQLLWQCLSKKGYDLMGWGREAIRSNLSFNLAPVNISSSEEVSRAVDLFGPDEIYHLAAYHHSSEQLFTDNVPLFQKSVDINLMSLLNVLQAVHNSLPSCRVFYAASSRIFGASQIDIQTETSPVQPFCAYGITKVGGLHACRYFRDKHATYASVGILFNHESVLRAPFYLSKKIISTALAIKRGRTEKLILGNLQSGADWGYAPDTMEAIHAILQLPQGDDFIIATGEKNTVQGFAETAFRLLGLDWREHVEENRQILREIRTPLIGDFSKLQKATGWKPRHSFEEMIRQLILDEGGEEELFTKPF